MNGRQKVVLVLGFLLFLTAGLYPPWKQSWAFIASGEDIQFRIASGSEQYSWIFRPPGAPAWVDGSLPKPDDPNIKDEAISDVSENGMRAVLRSVRAPGHWRARIDTARLLIEWAMIAAFVGVGVLVFAARRASS